MTGNRSATIPLDFISICLRCNHTLFTAMGNFQHYQHHFLKEMAGHRVGNSLSSLRQVQEDTNRKSCLNTDRGKKLFFPGLGFFDARQRIFDEMIR